MIALLLAVILRLLLPVADHPRPALLHQTTHTAAASSPTTGASVARNNQSGTMAAQSSEAPAPQLPDEVIGRAITCDDGSTGYVTDADLTTDCPQR